MLVKESHYENASKKTNLAHEIQSLFKQINRKILPLASSCMFLIVPKRQNTLDSLHEN